MQSVGEVAIVPLTRNERIIDNIVCSHESLTCFGFFACVRMLSEIFGRAKMNGTTEWNNERIRGDQNRPRFPVWQSFMGSG